MVADFAEQHGHLVKKIAPVREHGLGFDNDGFGTDEFRLTGLGNVDMDSECHGRTRFETSPGLNNDRVFVCGQNGDQRALVVFRSDSMAG